MKDAKALLFKKLNDKMEFAAFYPPTERVTLEAWLNMLLDPSHEITSADEFDLILRKRK
jgi:hypothetical protein